MTVCSSAPNLTCYFPTHHVFRPLWIVVYALPPSTFELRSWIHRYRGQTPLSLPSCANGFCTTCSTALPSTPLLTCQHHLRGCCVLLYGFGFPGLVFGLCLWFFISIFVVFRQNGFQSAMRWVVSSGCCSLLLLDGFRSSSDFMCFCPSICHTAYSFCCPTALQWLTKAKWTCASSSPELPGFLHLARKANYVGCSTRHLLRSTRTGEPPPPAYVERQSVMQLLLGVQHDGTTPQLPTELQQVTTPPWGMDRLRTKIMKVLTSPATSRPTAPISSEEVVILLNTEGSTGNPLPTNSGKGRGNDTPRAVPFASGAIGMWCGFSIVQDDDCSSTAFRFRTAALVREGVLLFLRCLL